MDMVFEKFSDYLELFRLNRTTAREHMVQIEHGIRVFKELASSVIVKIPFASLYKQIVIHLICFVVTWFNAFPVTDGISEKQSLIEIFTGCYMVLINTTRNCLYIILNLAKM